MNFGGTNSISNSTLSAKLITSRDRVEVRFLSCNYYLVVLFVKSASREAFKRLHKQYNLSLDQLKQMMKQGFGGPSGSGTWGKGRSSERRALGGL